MARMIDADALIEWFRPYLHTDEPIPANVVIEDIRSMPTLTQPNEPLTLEKLENMEDTTPVWWDQINSWVLVYKGNLTTWSGKHLYAKGCNGKFYRRPPEGEEETE